jgi:Ca2+-binding EF-hand superfamily protein
MTAMGDEPVSDEEVDMMIKQADLDHDGKINYEGIILTD